MSERVFYIVGGVSVVARDGSEMVRLREDGSEVPYNDLKELHSDGRRVPKENAMRFLSSSAPVPVPVNASNIAKAYQAVFKANDCGANAEGGGGFQQGNTCGKKGVRVPRTSSESGVGLSSKSTDELVGTANKLAKSGLTDAAMAESDAVRKLLQSRSDAPKYYPAKLAWAISDWMDSHPAQLDSNKKWVRARGIVPIPDRAVLEMLAAEQDSYTGKGMDLDTLKSYSALKEVLAGQYEAVLDSGLKVYAWKGEGEPYKADPGKLWGPSSDVMRKEVERTGEFHFFMTDVGFGSEGGAKEGQRHPLLDVSPYKTSDGKPMVWNDVFRVVHDAVGHMVGGYSFSGQGEFNAMLCHASTMPREAIPALFGETFGQTSYYETRGKYANQNTYISRHLVDLMNYAEERRVSGKVLKSFQLGGRSYAKRDSDEPLGFGRLKRQPLQVSGIEKAFFKFHRHSRVLKSSDCGANTQGGGGFQRGNSCGGGKHDAGGLVDNVRKSGGFTYSPISGGMTKKGFALSVFPKYEKKFGSIGEVTAEVIADHIADAVDEMMKSGDNRIHVGAWHNSAKHGNSDPDEKVYLDVSIVVDDQEEAKDLARKHGQLAIFDLGNGVPIETMTQEERREWEKKNGD